MLLFSFDTLGDIDLVILFALTDLNFNILVSNFGIKMHVTYKKKKTFQVYTYLFIEFPEFKMVKKLCKRCILIMNVGDA